MPDPKVGYATTLKTADGAFRIIANATAVIASGWTTDDEELLQHVSPQLLPVQITESRNTILDQASAAVEAYYAGDPTKLSKIPVQQHSGPFREKLWKALHSVAYGEQISYAELSAMAGNPRAARAAGTACSRNSVALFVPCHRVITSARTLGGFGFGLSLKQRLLQREALGLTQLTN